MLIDSDETYAEFRREVRSFLDENLDAELQSFASRQSGVQPHPYVAKRWHELLFRKGWITPAWPVEYGGLGWAPTQMAIFQDQCALVGAPKLPGMGLRMCASVLFRYGTKAQKDFFLPRIRSGEHYWCQGYSEPNSGSDLASIRTLAARDGQEYVVSGSKIWTTHAHVANWMFLLARTRASCKPQKGITFLLLPMDALGVTVRPILSMSGEHELNEVFLDEVRIPVENRIGDENDGWSVAKYLLMFERGGTAYGPVFAASIDRLLLIASCERADNGHALLDDPLFSRKLAEIEIEATAVACMEARLSQIESGSESSSYGASLKKLAGSTLVQKISELCVEALGNYARPNQINCLGTAIDTLPVGPNYAATPTAAYLNKRGVSIFGGAREIQKDILAATALGL